MRRIASGLRFITGHTVECVKTLDHFQRCTQCLKVRGRESNDAWRVGDEDFIPPMLVPRKETVH